MSAADKTVEALQRATGGHSSPLSSPHTRSKNLERFKDGSWDGRPKFRQVLNAVDAARASVDYLGCGMPVCAAYHEGTLVGILRGAELRPPPGMRSVHDWSYEILAVAGLERFLAGAVASWSHLMPGHCADQAAVDAAHVAALEAGADDVCATCKGEE